jgi:GNAT superfamily N-acetyltransferase
MIAITTAASDEELEAILRLQRLYHLRAISDEVAAAEGFVFAEHTLPLLRRMAALSPQAIAVSEGQVVGYCLSLPHALQAEVPALAPMFEQFARCSYRGSPLAAYRFVVGGQVCVDRAHRGKGLLRRLYEHLGRSVTDCDLCVTEIAIRNRVSLRAHEKMGFEIISTYSDASDDWAVVAWELSPGAVAVSSRQ